ncbi:hypothetical protein V500_03504 [Pseudogymnoascus sp. VKM F-4518 (FW-2643)]|nr:hypothetical protein V500_03504 [Pseudogymnoascus sp. VKM F-4518 (FW-2643)]
MKLLAPLLGALAAVAVAKNARGYPSLSATAASQTSPARDGAVFFFRLLIQRYVAAECPDALFFNSTNSAFYADCAQFNYACTNGSAISFNDTGGVPPPIDCDTKQVFELYFQHDSLTGPIVLPGVVEARIFSFYGSSSYNKTAAEMVAIKDKEISSIDFPDLVNITYDLNIRDMHNLASISMPKLENIGGSARIYLRDGPAISLSLPKLFHVKTDIDLFGKIDALEFPALISTPQIKVNTTGDLDCIAFAKSVLNATEWPVYGDKSEDGNSSVVCNSKKASVTMHPLPSTASRAGLGFCGNLMLLAILVAGANSVV